MLVTATRRIAMMITSSYPRFPGDSVGSFMEPIATGLAARGHEVHMVLPWHPRWRRGPSEGGVHFHPFRYAPLPGLNVFGYAAAMRADVSLRVAAVAVAPLAFIAGWRCARRVARECRASLVHAHWVVPGGVIGAAAAGDLPLVISLHGSDVFVAERHGLVGRAARAAFGRAAWVTACSDDLRDRAIALGARPDRMTVVPYGVDGERFRPDPAWRAEGRRFIGVAADAPLVFSYGRLVEKKGFEYLIAAATILTSEDPAVRVAIAGQGDLDATLRAQAAAAGLGDRVSWLGEVPHDVVPSLLAAADVAVVPSVHDESGNVDGLPNTALEAMASGTALVATRVGGLGTVAVDGRTAQLVPERDARALANAISGLLNDPARRAELGRRARDTICREYSWARVAERFESIYDRIGGPLPQASTC
jgi:glycosyltransferase involved in cell wall biosynthesis